MRCEACGSDEVTCAITRGSLTMYFCGTCFWDGTAARRTNDAAEVMPEP